MPRTVVRHLQGIARGAGKARGAKGVDSYSLLALNFTFNNAYNRKAYSKVILSGLLSRSSVLLAFLRRSSLLDPSKASSSSLLSNNIVASSSRYLILVSTIYIYIYKTYNLSYKNYL